MIEKLNTSGHYMETGILKMEAKINEIIDHLNAQENRVFRQREMKHFEKNKPVLDALKKIEVKANYSFWRHPIQWLKEYKQRRLMEKLIAFKWENGMKEAVEEQVKNNLILNQ